MIRLHDDVFAFREGNYGPAEVFERRAAEAGDDLLAVIDDAIEKLKHAVLWSTEERRALLAALGGVLAEQHKAIAERIREINSELGDFLEGR
jgi:predicted metal-dependent phosphoesterase TrpH